MHHWIVEQIGCQAGNCCTVEVAIDQKEVIGRSRIVQRTDNDEICSHSILMEHNRFTSGSSALRSGEAQRCDSDLFWRHGALLTAAR